MSSPITQDNAREQQIIEYLGLTKSESRIGHDSTLMGFPVEIKSVTKNKSVSTARQVHPNKIRGWRGQYWVFAKGPKTATGMDIQELYVCHPTDLEPFFARCEAKIAANWEPWSRLKVEGSQTDIERITKVIEVGTRLDDPGIPWGLITRVSHQLPTSDPEAARAAVRAFVASRPL